MNPTKIITEPGEQVKGRGRSQTPYKDDKPANNHSGAEVNPNQRGATLVPQGGPQNNKLIYTYNYSCSAFDRYTLKKRP